MPLHVNSGSPKLQLLGTDPVLVAHEKARPPGLAPDPRVRHPLAHAQAMHDSVDKLSCQSERHGSGACSGTSYAESIHVLLPQGSH